MNSLILETFSDSTVCVKWDKTNNLSVDNTLIGYEYVEFLIESDSEIQLQYKQSEIHFLKQFSEKNNGKCLKTS